MIEETDNTESRHCILTDSVGGDASSERAAQLETPYYVMRMRIVSLQ